MQEALLPVIDLSEYDTSDLESLKRVAALVGAAARGEGFFYVKNHGIRKDLVAEAFRESRAFFELPLEEKQVLAVEIQGNNRGYYGMENETLDSKKGPDKKEAFHVGLPLDDDDDEIIAKKPFRIPNRWPKSLPTFGSTLSEYYRACMWLCERIQTALAFDLSLPRDFFIRKFSRPMGSVRLLRYPAAGINDTDPPGAGEHTDWGSLTLLATDDVGGLEIKNRSGQWLAAPVIPDSFIVNIGDQLMRWTNDIYVSTPHRVVQRAPVERFSIAFFYDPNPETLIETIPSCIPPGQTPRYPPILAGDYLQMRLDATLGVAGYKG